MRFQKIKGLIAACFTPFQSDGKINFDLIPAYDKFLKNNGVAGVFVAGTTGEGLSLTLEERKQLTTAWMPHQAENFKIIIHVGANSLEESRALASHAAAAKADGIGMSLPGFFKPSSLDDLVQSCSIVAEKAPELPFYYYHLPTLTGIDYSMLAFAKMALKTLPNFAGLKYTNANLMEFHLCSLIENGKVDMLFGRDEELLAALTFDCEGAVGSTYNYMAPIYQKVIDSFQDQQMKQALAWQSRAIRIVEILLNYGGGVSCGKAIMSMTMREDFGKCRLPVRSLKKEEIEQLKLELEAIEYFDFCSKKTI